MMTEQELQLKRFSTRTLNMLATIFGGCGDARVILSERATNPLTVALGSRTIILNPDRSGLYDLALGAVLLKHRPLLSKGPKDAERLDRWLNLKAQKVLGREAQQELQSRFCRIDRLPGNCRPGRSLEGLKLVDKCVEWEALKRSSMLSALQPPTSRAATGLSLEAGIVPELEITGAEDDFNWIVESLEDGSLPMQTLPHLDELPFVRIPLRIESAERFPLLEEWDEQLADAGNKATIASLMKCHRDKAVVRERRKNAGRHSFSGTHLDPNRLVESIMNARVGLSTPIFRQAATNLEPVFDPDQFLVVMSFDLNDLRDLSWNGNRSSVLRFLAVLLTCYHRLGVHLIVQGTADQTITLSNGKTVCLHFTSTLKSVTDSYEDVLLPRLAHLMQKPPQLPGESGCFHAAAAEVIRATFNAEAATGDYSYFTQIWWARHLLSSSSSALQSPSFLQRTADHIDYTISELERDLSDGTLDALGCFLPRELKQLGQNGRFLQGVKF